MDKNKPTYVLHGNSLLMKKMFDKFYIVPKNFPFSAEQKEFLEENSMKLLDENIANGKDGYIVFRGKKLKSLNKKQIEEIKADNITTQRDLAFKYNVSAATINKIKNDKY